MLEMTGGGGGAWWLNFLVRLHVGDVPRSDPGSIPARGPMLRFHCPVHNGTYGLKNTLHLFSIYRKEIIILSLSPITNHGLLGN